MSIDPNDIIPIADLPTDVPGQYDYLIASVNGRGRKVLAPEVTAAAAHLQAVVDDLQDDADASLNQAVVAAKEDIAAAISGIGYLPPVPFAAGLLINSTRMTVEREGQVYAPLQSALPFTTTANFEPAQWRLLQGVLGADLAASSGAGMVGFRGRSVASKLTDCIDLLDYIPVAQHAAIFAGTSSFDASSAINAAATDARVQGKGLKCERAGRIFIAAPVDLRLIADIDVRANLQCAAGLSTPAVTVGGGSNRSSWCIRFADVTDGTSIIMAPPPAVPVLRIAGLKRSIVEIGSCNYLQLWADSAAGASADSNAYNQIHLKGACARLEVTDSGSMPISWNTENTFFGGGIIRLVIEGRSYPHNHNKLYNPTFEGSAVSLQFKNAWTNQVYGARFESVTASPGVVFDAVSFGNTIINTWSGVGNPRNQFIRGNSIPIADFGSGNMVATESSTQFRKTSLFSVDGSSGIVANAAGSVSLDARVNPMGLAPLARGLILPSLAGAEVPANRWVGMSALIPVQRGDVIAFDLDTDGKTLRPFVFVYGADGAPLTSEAGGGAYFAMPSMAINASGYYSSSANLSNGDVLTGAVARSEVKFVRVGVGALSPGFLRSASAALWTQALARDATENAANRRSSLMALPGVPTRGFLPVDSCLYDSVNKRINYVSFEHQSTLTAALSGGSTSISVASAAGVANGDVVGVQLADGRTHWSAVSGLSGTTFNVDAVPAGRAAGVGARVVFNRWAF